jgi:hypothetical protein
VAKDPTLQRQINACHKFLSAARAFARHRATVGQLAPIQHCEQTQTGELMVYCKDPDSTRKILEFLKTS